MLRSKHAQLNRAHQNTKRPMPPHQPCYKMITTCYGQTISDLLEQLVASLLASSTLLHDDNNLLRADDIRLVRTTCASYKMITTCYQQVVIILSCYVQTISDLLEQLVASLSASSTLLQDDNNLFQICQQLRTSRANISR